MSPMIIRVSSDNRLATVWLLRLLPELVSPHFVKLSAVSALDEEAKIVDLQSAARRKPHLYVIAGSHSVNRSSGTTDARSPC